MPAYRGMELSRMFTNPTLIKDANANVSINGRCSPALLLLQNKPASRPTLIPTLLYAPKTQPVLMVCVKHCLEGSTPSAKVKVLANLLPVGCHLSLML